MVSIIEPEIGVKQGYSRILSQTCYTDQEAEPLVLQAYSSLFVHSPLRSMVFSLKPILLLFY